jgi:hypothetical protein
MTKANDQVMRKEEEIAQFYSEKHSDYYEITELSEMTMTVARDFINERHKQIITSDNHWRDPTTGRICLYEQQGQTNLRI